MYVVSSACFVEITRSPTLHLLVILTPIGSGGFKEKGPGGKRNGTPCIHNRITNKLYRVWYENYRKQKNIGKLRGGVA